MNKWEQIDEKETATAWLRPQRKFIYDTPIYPWAPFEPLVNFDLRFKQ